MSFLSRLFLVLLSVVSQLSATGPLMRLIETRAPFPPVQHLHDVTYADGRFIATGNHNTLLTSTDGIQWEAIELENPFHWYAAVHTGSDWKVFGDTLQASSPDGVTWTLQEGRHYDSLIVLPDGTYASARSNSPYLSDDGVVWRSVRPRENNTLRARGIATNGERLVIVGSEGTILSSDDQGMTWTPRLEGMIEGFTGRREDFLGVRYVDGAFYAFGLSGLLMTSADGLAWTLIPAPRSNTLTDVVRFQGKLYVSMVFSSAIAVTSDMVTWEYPRVGAGSIEALAASEERLVGVSEEGGIYTSPDGTEWQSVGSNSSDQLIAGAYGDDHVVLLGFQRALHSSDGILWEEIQDLAGDSLFCIAHGNGRFVIGSNSASVRTSDDGITWTSQTLPAEVVPEGDSLGHLIHDGEQFVGLTHQDHLITSTDGLSWEKSQGPTYAEGESPRELRMAGDRFVIVGGADQTFFASDDATTWEQIIVTTETEGATILDVTYGNGLYLVVDNRSKLYTSQDGVSWELSTSRITGGGYRLEYAEGQFYILTRSNVYATQDGKAVRRLSMPTDVMPGVLIHRPQQIILAGAYGQILSSPEQSAVGYEAWRKEFFTDATPLAAREPLADADLDGESNFEEYAYGNLPEDPSSRNITSVIDIRRSRGAISSVDYEFLRNAPRYQDGVQYLLEYSVDLQEWTPIDLSTVYSGQPLEGQPQHLDRVAVGSLDRDDERLKNGFGYFRHRVVPLSNP